MPKPTTQRTFTALDGTQFNIRYRKSAVFFELVEDQKELDFDFKFSKDDFDDVLKTIVEAAQHAWSTLNPRDATSEGSDYWEYYDRELDNNGYFTLGRNDSLRIERPTRDHKRMYKFNKRKMETLLFDIQQHYGERIE